MVIVEVNIKKNFFRAIILTVSMIIFIPIVFLVTSSLWDKSFDNFDSKKDLKSYYNTFSGDVTYCDIFLGRYENSVVIPYKTLRLSDINVREFAVFLKAAQSFDKISSADYIKEKSINVFINVVENNKTSHINIYINLEKEEMYLPESQSTLKIKKEYLDYLEKLLL